jgi:hypothetical protein
MYLKSELTITITLAKSFLQTRFLKNQNLINNINKMHIIQQGDNLTK